MTLRFINQKSSLMNRVKIVATVGPASEKFEDLEALAVAGVNVFRLNFSHGTHEWHGEVIKRIKRLNKKCVQPIAVLLDTKGPEIRTADLKVPIQLKKGDKIILTVDHSDYCKSGKIGVNYDGFLSDVEIGEKVLVDNGVMNLRVVKKKGNDVVCEVLDGGELGSRRHLNLPGKEVSLEAITKKDWGDIAFGVEMGVDFIALSFVRRGAEVKEVKKFLEKEGSNIEVIAKIESFEATKHLDEIGEAADGLMVARGDLGAEVPFCQVPRWQREIIDVGKKFQKPVIVATQMLESMMSNPIPTRAEVSDVSMATFQRADAVMLSGETAGGKYPIKVVETMAEIVGETEQDFLATRPFRDCACVSVRGELSKVAAKMVSDMKGVSAIFVVTRSGFMARQVSCCRPGVPVFAFTNVPGARRRMQLLWGVDSFRIDFSSDPEKTILRAKKAFLEKYPKWRGEFVLLADSLVEGEFVPMLQVRGFGGR